MSSLKPGARLRSAACTTEVVIVKGSGEVELRCGGAPLVALDAEVRGGGSPRAPLDTGTLLGKRYTNEDGSVEVLCTKAGAGTLSIDDDPMELKGAKPLPSSD